MAHIFISYAKKDTRQLAESLYRQLNDLDGITAWMDMSLEADASWAMQIQREIDRADYVVVLLSSDVMRPVTATQSRSFVLNEVDYARQDNTPILPVAVEKIKIPVQLAGIQFIDITRNPDNPEKIIRRIKKRFPRTAIAVQSVYSLTDDDTVIGIPEFASNNRQARNIPVIPEAILKNRQTRKSLSLMWILTLVLVTITLLIGLWALPSFFDVIDEPIQDDLPSNGNMSNASPLEIAGMTQTQEMANFQLTLDESSRLQVTSEIQTATAFAPTKAVQQLSTVDAILTQTRAANVTSTQTILNVTGTAYAPIQQALDGVLTTNDEWTPYIREFDGVEMALVPSGCFLMGNDPDAANGGDADGGRQCFNEPFWIDRYEVDNTQFTEFLNSNDNQDATGDEYLDSDTEDNRIHYVDDRWAVEPGYEDHPVIEITWFGALEYCNWRSGMLPTEAQWEYSARGVEGLTYPWGNEWNADNTVWNRSGSAATGSILPGSSWIGALDMSGNVWEWTSSPGNNYPFNTFNEDLNNRDIARVLRGGSWNYYDPDYLRSASRIYFNPDVTRLYWGVRCARSFEQ